MTTNLYMVLDANYDWCCFAFDTSRNRAKLRVAQEFGNDYTEMRCKTLKKGVNIPVPMLVTHPKDEGYDIVQVADIVTEQKRKAVSDMPRYIDADKLIAYISENVVCTSRESEYCKEFILEHLSMDWFAPPVDVVPRSEVDKVRLLAYESGKREVAREISTALLKEIIEARNSNFEAIRERETKHNVNRFKSTFCYYCDGKIHALDGMFYLVNELLEKYEGDE